MNIILCGPPFAGKTTMGKLVSQQLGWLFIDTDRLAEKHYQEEYHGFLSCREIYRKDEQLFRLCENRALHSLLGSQKCIIALGGGSLSRTENVEVIKQLGKLMYLKTPIHILQNRLLTNALPSYLEKAQNPLEQFKELVESRHLIYEKYADKIIEMDSLSESQILSMICGESHGQ